MASAAYTLKLIESKKVSLSDFEKAPNTYMPIAELHRWLGVSKDECPDLLKFVTDNCLDETYTRSEPCFKIALNSKNKLTLYLVEKALNYFLTTHKLSLNQMGISNERINFVLNRFKYQPKTEEIYALHHLITPLMGRSFKFKYHLLPRKTIEALLKEEVMDESGAIKPLMFFISIASRQYLAVRRENIPHLLEKWGKTFGMSDAVIQKSIHNNPLPDINKDMVELSSFSKDTQSSDSFMHWFLNTAPLFFKKDFEGENPIFIKAKTDNMQEVICLNQDKIKSFVQDNKDFLLMHGLNPIFVQKKTKTPLESTTPAKFPCLLVNQLAQKLGKATDFIPGLKKFIVENCLNDTFMLKIAPKNEIKAPVFLYYKSFSSEETLYIYEKAVPDFVNAHLQKLLDMGVSFQTLNGILNEKKMGFSHPDSLWALKDLYLHSFSPLSEKEFNAVISNHLKDTYHLLQKDGELKKLNIFVQTPAKKNPIKVMTAALPILLNKTKDKLGLSNLDIDRLVHLSLMKEIPEVIDIKSICQTLQVPDKNESKVIDLFKLSKNRAYRQYFPDRSRRVIPVFGYNRDKSWGLKVGIYKSSLAFCLKMIQDELIQLGANPKKIHELKQLHAYEKILNPIKKYYTGNRNPFQEKQTRQKE